MANAGGISQTTTGADWGLIEATRATEAAAGAARVAVSGAMDAAESVHEGRAVDALAGFPNQALHDLTAEQLDRGPLRHAGPADLARLLTDPRLDARARAKVVEVALRRGGDGNPLVVRMQRDNWTVKEAVRQEDAYRELAVRAVLDARDSGAVLAALSDSDRLLPSGLHPATQLLRLVSEPGGRRTADQIGDWMLRLPPHARGQACFHLIDAARRIDGGRVTVEVEVGVPGVPVKGKMQYHARDEEWGKRVDAIRQRVDRHLEEHKAEVEAYNAGYRRADPERQ